MESPDVLIVGGGVAGLSAAWRLAEAGFAGSVLTLELGDRAGGTSAMGQGPAGEFPLGAHYITLPSPEARALRHLLRQLGIITGFDADNRPFYRDTDLCLDPEERLFHAGEWSDELWPAAGEGPEDREDRAAWQAHVLDWTQRRGADGKPAFAIPVAASSWDPEIRALAARSFEDYLADWGLRSPRLRWQLRYAVRDDYGGELAHTSAWAGLHYHCARRPDPAQAPNTHVLTWPGGNGALVRELRARSPWPLRTGAMVRRVEPGSPVRVAAEIDGAMVELRPRALLLCVPPQVRQALLGGEAMPHPDRAPWRVVQLHCDRLPRSRGLDRAWDSVIYEAGGLGYVSSAHQRLSRGGPTTLSWYEPLSEISPAEGRKILLAEEPAASASRALDELAPAHADLAERVQSIEVVRWGHGTALPAPGWHERPERLGALAAPLEGVFFASTDLSGLSLFEEAHYHGVRAAEEALASLGHPVGESLL